VAEITAGDFACITALESRADLFGGVGFITGDDIAELLSRPPSPQRR
jgi:hypothetical protein